VEALNAARRAQVRVVAALKERVEELIKVQGEWAEDLQASPARRGRGSGVRDDTRDPPPVGSSRGATPGRC
jgi:hypothetical protein